ncbi:unnamed protein product [Mytilus edulis]|uniref:Vitellogenin receptor n=1 Tax=Mytilus edulis TaxID=6550 RepID=A0A8S3UN66_MYTED|nr:unnamed protein product [Mytilus edulis]
MEPGKQIWLLISLIWLSAEKNASTIKELDLNTGNVTLVVNTASVVYSMAYDYENKYLYVPRSTQNDIMRLRYPPENVSTFEKIVSAGSPTAISIDQINEHLYWTDSYAFGRIGRCNFDGTNIVTIISERDVWGLAIDPTHRYVFQLRTLTLISIDSKTRVY